MVNIGYGRSFAAIDPAIIKGRDQIIYKSYANTLFIGNIVIKSP